MDNKQLMDEALELLADHRDSLDEEIAMLEAVRIEFLDASKEDRQEFEEALREYRQQLAATKNASVDSKADRKAEPRPVKDPSDGWTRTEPLKFLMVEVTGRSNFWLLVRAAGKLLLGGRATFIFKKPVRGICDDEP